MHKLDIRDRKILFELDKNSRMSLTNLAKKLKTSKEVIFHRINNLKERNILLQCHAILGNYRFGLMLYKIYLKFSNVSSKEEIEILDYLKSNQHVMYLANSRGRWDLMIGIWAPNLENFYSVNNEIINKLSKYIQDRGVSISMKTTQFNRRYLYSDGSEPCEFDFGENKPQVKIDKEDRKILDILTQNSRTKLTQIASQTGISTDMVRYRIKKLENEKIITGYKCLFNSEKLGFVTCKSFIFFENINEIRKKEFLNYCKTLPNVINLVDTFAAWDLEIMFEIESFEEFYKIMDKLKNKFKDIIKFYEGMLIYQEPKQIFIDK
jgi:Lrp/AsnC family transcriptional regulator, leucine-responsive regulatory protein